MRLAGAWLVLFSHAFALSGHAGDEPIAAALGGATDGGRLAVGMFFVVSGFLVTRSVLAHRPADYLRARFLRLWPALAALLLVQTLILGPAMTALPLGAYVSAPATWLALLRGLVFSPQLGLPGVFTRNTLPDAVNGSLWTVRIEAVCYLLLLAARAMDLLRGRRVVLLAAAALALGAVQQAGPAELPRLAALASWLYDMRVVAIGQCGVHFVMGALLWVHRDLVQRSAALALAGLLSLLLLAHTAFAPVMFAIVFPYLVICLGLGRPVGEGAMRRLGDISYGTYLYAFPVQQTVVSLAGGRIGPWELAASATLPVVVLALLSQRMIERPALRLKARLVAGRPARAEPSPMLIRTHRRAG